VWLSLKIIFIKIFAQGARTPIAHGANAPVITFSLQNRWF